MMVRQDRDAPDLTKDLFPEPTDSPLDLNAHDVPFNSDEEATGTEPTTAIEQFRNQKVEPPNVNEEIAAMRTCNVALKKLDFAQRRRVLVWLEDRFF